MKKLICVFLFSIVIIVIKGQNYSPVTLYYTTGKFEDAKKEADKLMADPKSSGKAETILWKLNVYSELVADETLRQKYPDALAQAVDAMNQYTLKEPSLAKLKEYGLRPVYILYSTTFSSGRDFFQKSDWQNSFQNFSTCQQVSEYIGKYGLSTSGKYTIDTIVVLYTGYAAQNAGKMNEAVARYKALADWNIGGEDYKDIYKYILDYSSKQKDRAGFDKYVAIAKKIYPKDRELWNMYVSNYNFSSMSLAELMKKYKADASKGNMTEEGYLNYAENFSTAEKDKLNTLSEGEQYDLKLICAEAYTKAYSKNNNSTYAFNAGITFYSLFAIFDEQYNNLKGNTPDIAKQKMTIKKKGDDLAIKSIEWLEKAYTALKANPARSKSETDLLKRSTQYLADLFLWKETMPNMSSDDVKNLHTKYNFYTAETGKY
jgi:hypothetical protein